MCFHLIFSKLSEAEISNLRVALGIIDNQNAPFVAQPIHQAELQAPAGAYEDEYDMNYHSPLMDLENMPRTDAHTDAQDNRYMPPCIMDGRGIKMTIQIDANDIRIVNPRMLGLNKH